MPSDDYYLLSGLRTPFCKLDGQLADYGAIDMSIPVVSRMVADVEGGADAAVWGTVAPNLQYSNIAREVWIDADLDPDVPAISTQMACATSMAAVFDATSLLQGGREVALCGGVEAMSNVQIGLKQGLSNWLRRIAQSKSPGAAAEKLMDLSLGEIGLHIPSVENRSTGKSMGEHCEEMVDDWQIHRKEQDRIAYASHKNAVQAWETGFFDDLVMAVDEAEKDAFPRPDTALNKLAKLSPAFAEDGTITAGNASPLTDGAAGVWLATEDGLDRFPESHARVKMVDWEVSAVDIFSEGLLMAPAYAIPRLLGRHDLGYDDVDLWEIHEAFAAQVACHIRALESEDFLAERVGMDHDFGDFPSERINPNGGSVALGHPFGATGARILSQAVAELASRPDGSKCIVSICANSGLGGVALLEA